MKTYGIRMLNDSEVKAGGIEKNLCSWFILIDETMNLLNNLDQLQRYNKNQNYCVVEVNREYLENGFYTMGNQSIMERNNSHGSTGIAKHGRFFSVSKDDINKVIKFIKYDKFNGIWQDLFDKVKEIGIPTGI